VVHGQSFVDLTDNKVREFSSDDEMDEEDLGSKQRYERSASM